MGSELSALSGLSLSLLELPGEVLTADYSKLELVYIGQGSSVAAGRVLGILCQFFNSQHNAVRRIDEIKKHSILMRSSSPDRPSVGKMVVYHHCLSSSQRRLSKPNRKVTLLTMSVTNGKNGKSRKTLKASEGRSDLNTLRDRAGTFQSQMIKKHLVVWSEHALICTPARHALGLHLASKPSSSCDGAVARHESPYLHNTAG